MTTRALLCLAQGAQAPRAEFQAAHLAIHHDPDSLDVWLELALGFIRGVAYAVPKLGSFATPLTLCHLNTPLVN